MATGGNEIADLGDILNARYRVLVRENFDLENLLLPIPVLIASIVDLQTLADILEAKPFPHQAETLILSNKLKEVKESLMNTSEATHAALKKTEENMQEIQLGVSKIPILLSGIHEALESQNAPKFLKNMKAVNEISLHCSKMSTEVVEVFQKIHDELIAAKKTFVQIQLKTGEQEMKDNKSMVMMEAKNKAELESLKELEEDRKKKEKAVEESFKNLKLANDTPGSIRIIVAHIVDNAMNLLSQFLSKKAAHGAPTSKTLFKELSSLAESKQVAAKDELQSAKAEDEEAVVLVRNKNIDKLALMIKMGYVKPKIEDDAKAMETIQNVLENLTNLLKQWEQLLTFFTHFEIITKTYFINVEEIFNWIQRIPEGKRKGTDDPAEKKSRLSKSELTHLNDISFYLSSLTGIYSKLASKKMQSSLLETMNQVCVVGSPEFTPESMEAARANLRHECLITAQEISSFLKEEERKLSEVNHLNCPIF